MGLANRNEKIEQNNNHIPPIPPFSKTELEFLREVKCKQFTIWFINFNNYILSNIYRHIVINYGVTFCLLGKK